MSEADFGLTCKVSQVAIMALHASSFPESSEWLAYPECRGAYQ